jgi:hypothetical protein
MTSLNFSSTLLGILHTEIHGTFEEGTETLYDEILPFRDSFRYLGALRGESREPACTVNEIKNI